MLLTLVVGSSRTALGTIDSTDSPTAGTRLISLATGTDAQLAATVDGREFDLSLKTATPVSDTAQTIYNLPTRNDAVSASIPPWSRMYFKSDNGNSDYTITYSLSIANAYLTPYDVIKGWAPSGRVWLEVVATSESVAANDLGASVNYRGWTASAAGTTYRPAIAPGTGAVSPSTLDPQTVPFLVPASTRKTKIEFASVLTLPPRSNPSDPEYILGRTQRPTTLRATVNFT